MSDQMKTNTLNGNVAVLANAIELGSRLIERTMGNDVSSTLDGKELMLPQIQTVFSARLKAALAPKTGG